MLAASLRATGVRARTAASAKAKAPARCASSGKAHECLSRWCLSRSALVGDHVVDGVVDRPRRCPPRELSERRGVRHAPAQLLETVVVRLLVRDERDPGLRARALDHPA